MQRTFVLTCMCVVQVQAAAKGNAERASEDGMDTDVPELAEVETFPAEVIDQLRAPPPQVALTMYHQKLAEVGFPCSTCCWSVARSVEVMPALKKPVHSNKASQEPIGFLNE